MRRLLAAPLLPLKVQGPYGSWPLGAGTSLSGPPSGPAPLGTLGPCLPGGGHPLGRPASRLLSSLLSSLPKGSTGGPAPEDATASDPATTWILRTPHAAHAQHHSSSAACLRAAQGDLPPRLRLPQIQQDLDPTHIAVCILAESRLNSSLPKSSTGGPAPEAVTASSSKKKDSAWIPRTSQTAYMQHHASLAA